MNVETFSFEPHAGKARIWNEAMHNALADSLDYHSDELIAVGGENLRDEIAAFRAAFGQGLRARAAAYAAHSELVDAVQRANWGDARDLISEIATSTGPRDLAIRTLARDHTPAQVDRIIEVMSERRSGTNGVRDAGWGAVLRKRREFDVAMDWAERNAPAFAAEFEELIGEVFMVAPPHTDEKGFDGGGSFRLWGAVFLNAEREVSTAELIATLAHETARAALYGSCSKELLVENLETELHWSRVLRIKRSMASIFHATFIAGRMVWMLDRVKSSSEFDGLERRWARSRLADYKAVFEDGMDTIDGDARLTPGGAAIFGQMERFQSEVLEGA